MTFTEVSSAVASKWTSCTQSVVYSGGSFIASDITLEECVFTCVDKGMECYLMVGL